MKIESVDGIGDEKNVGQNAKYEERDQNEYQEGNRGGREKVMKMAYREVNGFEGLHRRERRQGTAAQAMTVAKMEMERDMMVEMKWRCRGRSFRVAAMALREDGRWRKI